MRANVSLLTATAQTAIDAAVVDYQNAVAAHIGGDWSTHNQLRLYLTPFVEPVSGHTITDGVILRIQLTGTNSIGTGDGVFTMPAVSSGTFVDNGSAPYILTPPSDLEIYAGNTASFQVVAASASPMTYQWQYYLVDRSGAVNSTLVIPNAQAVDEGNYRVIVTNSHGSVVSSYGTLTVLANIPITGGGVTT